MGYIHNKKEKKRQLYILQSSICPGCKQRISFELMTFDHIIPQAKGGGSSLQNLQLTCEPCNNEKQSNTVEWCRPLFPNEVMVNGQIILVQPGWTIRSR